MLANTVCRLGDETSQFSILDHEVTPTREGDGISGIEFSGS